MVKKPVDIHARMMESDSLDNDDEYFLSEDYEIVDAESCDMLIETSDDDQQDIVKETNQDVCRDDQLEMSLQQNRMRLALGVLVRLVVPLCNGVVRRLRGIRGVRILKALKNIRASRQMLTNMLAYAANTISMSLSSVQVVHRIDPLLKIMKLRKSPSMQMIGGTEEQPPKVNLSRTIKCEPEATEKCVTLNILAEPPAGTPIRADIIFIHGLHGSLRNTWKQGLWKKDGRRVQFERPPRPPIRPPKRPRHSRSTLFGPPHSKKRARYCDSDNIFVSSPDDEYVPDEQSPECERNYTYEAEQPDYVHYCDDMEYSFPTFRLRLEELDRSATGGGMINSNHGSPVKQANKTDSPTEQDSEKWSPCWPGDWLPLDCPGVRVIALNYTTDRYLWRPLWVRKQHRTTLTERTREMTDLLIEKRVGHGHPIIWVGHSKGGLFIKQILVDAWDSGRPSTAPLWRSSKGVFFYSVPHRGSPMADFNLPLLRQSIELVEIQTNCASILELHRRFVALYQSGHLKIDVFSFVETSLTLMSVLYLRIVGVDSADPGIGEVCGVHLDHREICKPRNRNCILYTTLTKMINKLS